MHNHLESVFSLYKTVPEHTGLVLPRTLKIFDLAFCCCYCGKGVCVFVMEIVSIHNSKWLETHYGNHELTSVFL